MIFRLQSGGGMPPLTHYNPVSVTQPTGTTATTTTTSSKTTADTLTKKDLLKTLDNFKGLPSDMQDLKAGLIDAISTPGVDLFGSSVSLFDSTSDIDTQFANTVLGIKLANFSKERYDDARKLLNSNGGLNEVAVTNEGGVIVSDSEGNIKPISVDTYLANRGKYHALTNSNILYMRAYDSKFAHNDNLMAIAESGIGLTEINKQIKAALNNLGTTERTKESYDVIQGAETIKAIYEKTGSVKLEGLYKSTNTTKDQIKQAKAALSYIWNILPENAKTVLKVKAGGTEKAYEMIANFIASGTSDSIEHKESYVLDADGKKPGSKGSSSTGSDNSPKTGIVTNFILGRGKDEDFVVMNGTSVGLRVSGVSAPLTNNQGKVGGPMSLLSMQKSTYSNVLDWGNVSIGGVHVDTGHLHQIMNTDGNVHRIDFPYTTDAQGNIIPDYNLFKSASEADEEVRAKHLDPKTDYEAINAIYEAHNVPAKYSADGTLNAEQWTGFAVMNGNALSKAFNEDQSFNNLLKEASDNDIQALLKLYNDEAKISGANQEKGKDIEFDEKGWWDKLVGGDSQHWYSKYDTIFKGTIFVPIKNDVLSAMLADNTTITQNVSMDVENRMQDADVQNAYNDPGDLE